MRERRYEIFETLLDRISTRQFSGLAVRHEDRKQCSGALKSCLSVSAWHVAKPKRLDQPAALITVTVILQKVYRATLLLLLFSRSGQLIVQTLY
jgi:hypothetical protein